MGKPTTEELMDMIHDEWHEMHHNASLIHSMPDFQNDYEAELFWNVLEDEVAFRIEDLRDLVKESFGEDLTFFSYGRSGATIAPKEYMNPAPCSSFGSLRLESVSSGLDGYNELLHLLKMFSFINGYVSGFANSIDDWWHAMKVSNNYQEEIDKHGIE